VYSIRSHQQNCVRVVTKDDLIASVWGEDHGGTDVSGCKEGKERSWTQTTDVEKRAEELRQAVADPKLKARLVDLGGIALTGSPADFTRLIAEETVKWAKVVKFSGAKAE